ncbi:TetR/AcrR family transcriptional regulator [Bacillus sp. Marseille-P3661]|uniref:TetR/AcrR family transcriptional regulator n=1 Tax=Bacillus sp. Marseille-P3661 TaxID=1936234 RepID=UPI000C842D75|nr:TetR/AcrR family transcriptional regulator [Bacillus sp. Marseille-P3661]
MPKETFYNLHENKKQTLMAAIKEEFSRVPLFEASIANIVKTAGIPRGSFYQYFEDKEDAFFFLLKDYVAEQNNQFISILESHNGDLFNALVEFYLLIIKKECHLNFLRNAFLNMTHKVENTFSGIFSEQAYSKSFNEMVGMLDRSKLNFTNHTELFHIMQIITAVTFRNLIEKFAKNLSDQEAVEIYKVELNILKKGLAP